MKEFIYNQTKIPKEQWRYGFRSSAATGCGWIATYNALRLMDYYAKPEDLIHYYEHMLPLIHGNAGTTLLAPAVCFRQWDFPVKIIFDRRKFDEAVKQSDACILFYRWRNGWKFGAHFTALQISDGVIWGYNTFRNSTGPDCYGRSLESFLKGKKYFGAVLIAIQDKRVKKTSASD